MWRYIASFFGVFVIAALLLRTEKIEPKFEDQYGHAISEADFKALLAKDKQQTNARLDALAAEREQELEGEQRKPPASGPLTARELPPEASGQTALEVPQPLFRGPEPQYGCAENGSCYGDISPTTHLPKQVFVHGYNRKDGTHVQGHYRSHR